MFKKSFLGDYWWEINPKVTLHYVDESYLDITDGRSTTVIIEDVSYPLLGDFRKQFLETKGDLQKIKKVYLDNIKHSTYVVPDGEDYTPLMRIFTTHINQIIERYGKNN